MSVYNPPVATVPLFNPNDFNTTQVVGDETSTITVENNIENQQTTVDNLTTQINTLYAYGDTGQLGISNWMYQVGNIRGPFNSGQQYTQAISPDGLSIGIYLVTFSITAVFNLTNSGTITPIIAYGWSGLSMPTTAQTQINWNSVQASGKNVVLGGTFIIQALTNNTAVNLTWQVTATSGAGASYYFAPDLYAGDSNNRTFSATFIKLK
jgi:hypothetical protein